MGHRPTPRGRGLLHSDDGRGMVLERVGGHVMGHVSLSFCGLGVCRKRDDGIGDSSELARASLCLWVPWRMRSRHFLLLDGRHCERAACDESSWRDRRGFLDLHLVAAILRFAEESRRRDTLISTSVPASFRPLCPRSVWGTSVRVLCG